MASGGMVAVLVNRDINIKDIKKGKLHDHICGWHPPQYGDTGETALHAVLSVIAFAVALWSAFEQMRIFDMRYQLADGYAALAEEGWNRFDSRYRPLEAMMLAECSGVGPIKPDYELVRSVETGFVDFGREQGLDLLGRESKLNAVCPGRSRLRALDLAMAAYRDDQINLGYRDAETTSRAEDDMRFNRRAGLLDLGRDLLAQAASYGQTAGAILQSAAASQADTTRGAMMTVGYLRHRADTIYPEWLSRNSSFEDADTFAKWTKYDVAKSDLKHLALQE